MGTFLLQVRENGIAKGYTCRTPVKHGAGNSAQFDYSMEIPFPAGAVQHVQPKLRFEVWYEDTLSVDDLVATAELRLSSQVRWRVLTLS
jgi:hypothetical protein